MKQTKRPGQRPNGLIMSSLVRDIEDEPSENSSGSSDYKELALELVTPRLINKYRQSRIAELADSIRHTNNRLIHPIVVVMASDLPENNEVRQAIEAQGKSVRDFGYIIVAGERRYRAFRYLREQERALHSGDPTFKNPFDTITAHILTADEALNEQRFYKDSNDQARHMTPGEVVWFIKDALREVPDAESKRRALIEMNGGAEAGIDENPAVAARAFRVDSYCRWLIDREYGITDWSDGTLRNMATVAQKCTDDVADALISGEFPLREAKRITSLSSEVQRELLRIYKKDPEAYEAELAKIKPVKAAKKLTHTESKKAIRAILKNNRKWLAEFERLTADLSGDNDAEMRCIDCMTACISELDALLGAKENS